MNCLARGDQSSINWLGWLEGRTASEELGQLLFFRALCRIKLRTLPIPSTETM